MRGRGLTTVIIAAVLLGACAAEAALEAAAPAEEVERRTPEVVTEATPPEPVTSGDLEPVPGSSLTEVERLPIWFERLGIDANSPIARIPTDRRDPPRDRDLGALRVTDALERIPGRCPGEIRRVVAFDLGPDGSPRIHDGLALLARAAMVEAEWVRDLASRPCGSSGLRPFIYQEVAELPCGIPDGRPYRCLVITTSATETGRIVQYAPIDVRSGKIVSLREIAATVGGRGYDAHIKVGEVLCALLPTSEQYERPFKDAPCPALPAGVGLRPTADGLRVVIPSLVWEWTLDELLVPWEVLSWRDSVPLHEAPNAATVGGPQLRPTPDAIMLREAPAAWMGRLDVSSMIPLERIPDALADPTLVEGLGPRIVTSRIDRARRYCAAERRLITGVDLGPGAAASRMASDLVAVAAEFHTRSEWLTTLGEDWCLPYGESRPWSFQELAEEACELPGGPDVRCFTLTQWWYFEGTTGNPDHALDQPVYDTATGQRVPLATILAGAEGDATTAVARTEALLCESGVLRSIGLASDCAVIIVRRAHPTADGIWVGFDAREELGHLNDRYLEVFLPWSELWG